MFHFIRVTREDGRTGLVHPASVFAIYANKVSKSSGGGTVDVLSLTLSNNVTWHIVGETEQSFLSKLSQAGHCHVNVIDAARPEDMPQVSDAAELEEQVA